jgi:hypothetical protein
VRESFSLFDKKQYGTKEWVCQPFFDAFSKVQKFWIFG